MTDNLKQKAVNGVIWNGISRFSVQGLAFLFNMIIARKLMPDAYGSIAILSVFLSISEVFIDSGFSNALMRKKDRTQEDLTTVFYFNVAIAVFFYLILFAVSPAIANFYEMPILTKIMRVIGLTLILNALGTMQSTILTIRIDFKLKTKISILCSVLSGAFGIVLVYKGLGVWALVFQQLFSSFVGCVFNWLFVRWLPMLLFSWESLKSLFSYGSKLLLTGLMNSIMSNLSNMIVGKVYTAEDLGEYSKARSLSAFPSGSINGVIMSVAFPVLVAIQDQPSRLEKYYKKITNTSSYVIFPVMIGLAAVADPLVRVLLTDNWAGIILMFQISCFAAIWAPLNSANLSLLQVVGRSDYFLKLETIKKITGLVVLVVTIPFGVVVMCWGALFNGILNVFINAYYTKKILGYGVVDQLKGIFHILVHSIVMGVVALLVTKLFDNNILSLIVGSFAGAAYYITISCVLKFPELHELVLIIREKLGLQNNPRS